MKDIDSGQNTNIDYFENEENSSIIKKMEVNDKEMSLNHYQTENNDKYIITIMIFDKKNSKVNKETLMDNSIKSVAVLVQNQANNRMIDRVLCEDSNTKYKVFKDESNIDK